MRQTHDNNVSVEIKFKNERLGATFAFTASVSVTLCFQ